MNTIIATLGFEEKFIARCLLRNSVGADKLLLVTYFSEEKHSREKTEKALKIVEKIAKDYLDINVEVVEVEDPANFWENILTLSRRIQKELEDTEKTITLCLGGGMRALVVETLLAALILPVDAPLDRVKVEVDLETLTRHISFTIGQLQALVNLSSLERRIIEVITARKGYARLQDLAKTINRPRSTIHRTLQRLVEKKLLEKKPDGTYTIH